LVAVVSVVLSGSAGLWARFAAAPAWRPALQHAERFGIDVSNHQGSVDWSRVAADDIRFAYVKATEGGDFVDSRFAANWAGARAAGLDRPRWERRLLRRPARDGWWVWQASSFARVAGIDGRTDLNVMAGPPPQATAAR
jgi:lysozyme